MQLARRQVLFGLGSAALTGVLGADTVEQLTKRPPLLASLPIVPAAAPVAAPATVAAAPPMVRNAIKRVALHNLHTGDKLNAVYWENGDYISDALAEAKRVLRDWRNGEEHPIDPQLFDVMHNISERLETKAPFQIISGYRSPRTNAMLHERSSGVATHSQHMEGKASDVRIAGVQLAHLHKAALSLKAGGVGYYPVSDFVHIDVARVRSWQGA